MHKICKCSENNVFLQNKYIYQMKVSVLIPVYNVSAYLERFLESLWAQTFKDVEYVFMDDCSTDDCYDILSRELAGKENCRLLQHQKNQGLAQTRDDLLREAKGDFVCCIDSDDWLEPDYLEKLVEAATDEVDIVQCGYFEELKDRQVLHENHYKATHEQTLHDVIAVNVETFLWTKLIRRSLIQPYHWKAGANQGEDYLTTIWLYAHTDRIKIIPDALYHYNRQNESSITKTNTYRNFTLLFDEAERLMQSLGLLPKYQEAFNQRVFMFKKDMILASGSLKGTNPAWDIYLTYKPEINKLWRGIPLGKKNKIIFWLLEHRLTILAQVVFRLLR